MSSVLYKYHYELISWHSSVRQLTGLNPDHAGLVMFRAQLIDKSGRKSNARQNETNQKKIMGKASYPLGQILLLGQEE